MDYVPQEMGIYDGAYNDYNDTGCRSCHGNSTADRHHGVPMVVRDNLCTPCHPTCTVGSPDCENGITIHRNCLTNGCHNWNDVQFGNQRWHHNTDMAQAENCQTCHNPNLIGEITPFRDFSTYPPTVVTPTPFSCENCHWTQAVAGVPGTPNNPGHPSTYQHYDAWGNPTGYFEYNKEIKHNIDTHHMSFVGEVGTNCTVCHAIDPQHENYNPLDPELIRFCEICHTPESLHAGVTPHVSDTNGWLATGYHAGGGGPDPTTYQKFGGLPYTPQLNPGFTDDQMCFACHGDSVMPFVDPGTCTPAITTSDPAAGSCGVVGQLRGDCFGEEHIQGSMVQFAPKDLGVCSNKRCSINYGTVCTTNLDCPLGVGEQCLSRDCTENADCYTAYGDTCDLTSPLCNWAVASNLVINAWTNEYLEWVLPCLTYDPGNYCLRVKTDGGNSNKKMFTVKDHPTALSINKTSGACTELLTITGDGGFGNARNSAVLNGYGVTHVVVFAASSGEYTATKYSNWGDTSLQVKFQDFFEDKVDTCSIDPLTHQYRMEGNFVKDIGDENANGSLSCDWAIPVYDECAAEPLLGACTDMPLGTYSIYVKAIYFYDDDNSTGLSCGDTIYNVETSASVSFELTNEPFIYKLNPKQIVDANTAPLSLLKIFGGNYGISQEAGDVVRMGSRAQANSATLGLGKEMTKIKIWSNTLIKVRVTAPDTWRGNTKYAWVEKDGKKSNAKPLFIMTP